MLVSVGLGADAFSVGIGVGVCWYGFRQKFRLSFHFGLFQFLMPIIGWQIGGLLVGVIGSVANYIAGGILAVIAVRMLIDVFKGDDDDLDDSCDPTKGWSLVMLSVATSIDALGAGIGLGMVATNFLFVCAVIGVTATIMTLIGMALAGRLTGIFGKKVEAVGGIVLLLLSVKIALGW